jgi:hypothetical protein
VCLGAVLFKSGCMSPGSWFKILMSSWVQWCVTVVPTTLEAEAGGSWVRGQPGLHKETQSQVRLYSNIQQHLDQSWKLAEVLDIPPKVTLMYGKS